jgi:acyl-CoA synthetase (AMP-forming)/AMP-acid ligase II
MSAIDPDGMPDQGEQKLTVLDMFRRRLAADPDRVFLELPDGTGWTFRELQLAADELRGELVARGVTPGDVVGLYQWNEPSWFVSTLAVWEAGAVPAPCGGVSPASEAIRRFELVTPKIVVSSDVPDISDRWSVMQVDVGGRPVGEVIGEPAGDESRRTPPEDSPGCIFFTSGTSGDAKAVVKSHLGLADFANQAASVYSKSASFRPRMADTSKPPAISFNPFGQSACFGRLVLRLFVGRALVLFRRFNVASLGQVASRYPLDTLQLTPAMIHMLAFSDDQIDLSSLKYVNSSTAPLPTSTRDAFEARYGVPVLQAYGSTEGGVMALERLEDVLAGLRGAGAVGRISAESQWRIVDAEGRDVPTGTEGEILGRPKERKLVTADGESSLEVDEDGWYHTGDLARVDEHGILYITGRIKEMMIVGGFNVFPSEIEDALRELPEIRDAIVVGLADARLGEIPVAGILWAGGAATTRDSAVVQHLTAHARERLAAYKVPRRWFDLGAMPLTANGKLDRKAALGIAEIALSAADHEGAVTS